ncbi:MAG: hypothetical protein IID59_02940 [Proteobacteria bacterium]|nr:hypothetical protein [Pseudomonadota bacterium]
MGDRKGQFSIRINRRYRICFAWEDAEGQHLSACTLASKLWDVSLELTENVGPS